MTIPTVHLQRERHRRELCPWCGAGNFDAGWRSLTGDDGSAFQDCICAECGGGIREVLTVTSTVVLNPDRAEGVVLSGVVPA